MKIKHAYINAINIGLTMVVFLLAAFSVLAQSKKNSTETDLYLSELLTNLPSAGFATRLDYLKSFTSKKEILDAYHAGKLSKWEAEVAAQLNKVLPSDKMPMDTYGKVVDQNGQPVVGAKVRGFLEFEMNDNDKEHDTTSDSQGEFHFLGLHGKGLAMVPEKDGYEFNSKKLSNVNRPSDYIPDPKEPLIFKMYQLRGSEPMVHSLINSDVPCDGSVKRFNLLSSIQNNAGDLMVTLTRKPLNIDRRKPFDWSVRLEITNGGLQAVTNLYPNEAPVEGYQPILTLDFPTNAVGWKKEINNHYCPV